MRELQSRQELRNILVLCPKALVTKWQAEMKRFDEDFQPLTAETLRYCLNETYLDGIWPSKHARSIVHLELLRREEYLMGCQGKRSRPGLFTLNPPPQFDLLIVDEAHHLRTPDTRTNELARFLCNISEAVIFLTATPMHLGSKNLFTLLNLLRPDQFIDETLFQEMVAPNKYLNRAIRHVRSKMPIDTWQSKACFELDSAAKSPWGKAVITHDPRFSEWINRLRKNSELIDEERIKFLRDMEDIHTLAHIMNRTRRRDIGRFTIREPFTVSVPFTKEQQGLYDALIAYRREMLALYYDPHLIRLITDTLERQAASCLPALLPALDKFIQTGRFATTDITDDPELDNNDSELSPQLIEKAGELKRIAVSLPNEDPKLEALIRIVSETVNSKGPGKVLVFSFFLHTLSYLEKHLRQKGYRVAVVNGQVDDEEREKIRERFRSNRENSDAIDVLLSSEVGCEVDKVELKDDETLFVFPFNHNKVSPEQAFKDISERLRELGSRTLLFLNNIEAINWDIEGEESGDYIRETEPQDDNSRRVYIVSKEGSEKDEGEEWLIFERPVKSDKSDTPEIKVEVAFKVAKKGGKTKEGEEEEVIIPADDSCLIVFFPTGKETHLEFLIQGHYKTTPPRDNIKEDEWNKNLIKETALLVADTIPKIKELGLLTVDFLNVLPISTNDFPEKDMFRPIYDAVLNKLKSNEKLLPANDGGYISATQAFLARGKELIGLLGTEQLSLLFKKQDAQWLSSNITQDKNPELRTYLMEQLEVTEVTPEKFANQFSEEFIKEQDDDWVIKFYIFLKDQKALWKKKENYWTQEGPLRNKPFIRLEDNTHVAPFDNDNKPQAYLPSNLKSSFSTVKKKIADDEQAREFLKELGLREPDKIAEVLEFILPKYQKNVSKEENLQDVKKILQALETDSESKKNELIEQLKDVPFLLSTNNTGNTLYRKSTKIYLPQIFTGNDDLETYFEGNPEAYFLDEIYKDVVKEEQLLELGCLDEIYVEYGKPKGDGFVFFDWDGDWSYKYKRGLDGFDPNCKIDGLNHALEHITIKKALIIWKKLSQYHKSVYGFVESSTRQDFNPFLSKCYKKELQASIMGNLVRESKWLPDKQGNFHKPSEILLSDLPDDFEKESPEAKSLAEKLGFKKDIEQEYLSGLTEEEREKIEFAKGLTEDEIGMIKEKRKREREYQERIDDEGVNYADELAQAFNRPQRKESEGGYISPDPIPDINRRRERTQEEIEEARRNEPPISERFKRVPAKKWEQKNNEVRTFLKEQYGGKCQICGYTFKKRNGEPYFEGLYLVSRTKAKWIDCPGNVLCLCANCCAKFEHGQVEADNILDQITNFKTSNEGGTSEATVNLKLCNEDVELKFFERHIVYLQEILKKAKQFRHWTSDFRHQTFRKRSGVKY